VVARRGVARALARSRVPGRHPTDAPRRPRRRRSLPRPSGRAGARSRRIGRRRAEGDGSCGPQGLVRRTEGAVLCRRRNADRSRVPRAARRAVRGGDPRGGYRVVGDTTRAGRSADRSASRRRGACARGRVRAR
jgi:hypothetical protein